MDSCACSSSRLIRLNSIPPVGMEELKADRIGRAGISNASANDNGKTYHMLLEMFSTYFFQSISIPEFKKTLPDNASRQIIFVIKKFSPAFPGFCHGFNS